MHAPVQPGGHAARQVVKGSLRTCRCYAKDYRSARSCGSLRTGLGISQLSSCQVIMSPVMGGPLWGLLRHSRPHNGPLRTGYSCHCMKLTVSHFIVRMRA